MAPVCGFTPNPHVSAGSGAGERVLPTPPAKSSCRNCGWGSSGTPPWEPVAQRHVSSPMTLSLSLQDAPGMGCVLGGEQYGALGCAVVLWAFLESC